jgi:amino acid transporter
MNTYFVLYMLFKLDDIRIFLSNDYAWTFIVGFVLFVIYAVVTRGRDKVGDIVPFAGLWNEDKKEEHNKTFKKFIKIFTFVWFMQFTLNFIAFSLPSTGQAVAIIMGGKGVESETFKVLMSADPKIANYLKQELDDFLAIEEQEK